MEALRVREWDWMAKFAVRLRSSDIRTVVDAEFGSVTPSPSHPLKKYPVLGVALIVGLLPKSKCPEPFAEPPMEALRLREWDWMAKFAVRLRSSDIRTVVDAEYESFTPSPLHPMKA